MRGILYSFVVLLQVALLMCAPPPQKCKVSDSDCLKKVAQAMVPSFADGILGTDPLDPMYLGDFYIERSELRINLSNAVVTGLKSAVIDKIRIDMNKKELMVLYHGDVELTNHYKAEGKLMTMPMNGHGDAKMQITNWVTKLTIPFTIVKNKEGKDAMHMEEYKYEYEAKGGAKFELTNLFNGNKALSDPIVKFLNDNWKFVLDEFAAPILAKPMKKLFNAIRKYLQSMPLNEIVDALQ